MIFRSQSTVISPTSWQKCYASECGIQMTRLIYLFSALTQLDYAV